MRKERIYTNTNPKNFTDAIDEKIDRENMLRQLLQELPVQQKRVVVVTIKRVDR
ncbi:MAG: hypothetical protein KatS3mg101_1069 [Patescibacteria group bacterium]|nr:MAG: hypothetical protein KatS3mg101_1069 [Patescibacteria group bacterium]